MKLKKNKALLKISLVIACSLIVWIEAQAFYSDSQSQNDRDLSMDDNSLQALAGKRQKVEWRHQNALEENKPLGGAEDGLRDLKMLGRGLTDAEVELYSKYPDRMMRLKEIANYASEMARIEHAKDILVSEDAYRHVLWSWLLTKEYGEQFAKKVTDAHEAIGSKNTEAQHIMDYKNNEIGIKYALEGIEEQDILPKMMDDPDVIKYPEDIKYQY